MKCSAENHEILTLTSAVCDGIATAEELRQLEQLLSTSADARRIYFHYVDLITDLRQQQLRLDADQPYVSESAEDRVAKTPSQAEFAGLRGDFTRHVAQFLSRPTPFSIGVAALVIGLLLTAMAFIAAPIYVRLAESEPKDEKISRPVAIAWITGLHDAVWKEGETSTLHRGHLAAGHRLELHSGFVHLEYQDGVKVTLRGPCDYVIDSSNAGTLHSGEMVATVPPQAIGFRVATSAATITDLGTQFGIDAKGGDVTVHVLTGKVLAQPLVGVPKDAVELVAGDTLRFDGRWRNIAASEDELRRWQALARAGDIKPITGVTIHEVSSEMVHKSFHRRAGHLIDRSGLKGVDHSPYPDKAVPGGSNPGTMWLTNGTLAEPADPLPAHVTFDLGDDYELTGIHVWNYNESGTRQGHALTQAGAKDVRILVAPTNQVDDLLPLQNAGGDFVFAEASGADDYPGTRIDLSAVTSDSSLEKVRLVRFEILTNHGQVRDLVGLSEVQFRGRKLKQ